MGKRKNAEIKKKMRQVVEAHKGQIAIPGVRIYSEEVPVTRVRQEFPNEIP